MERICTLSGEKFTITDKDKAFYKALGVPLPTLSPVERQRRRLAWRNESKLYWRTCDGTGERILSVFAPEKPYTVYQYDYWISDAWSPMEYGRDFDFSRPFFPQFDELLKTVPQVARSAFKNVDSPYVNQAGKNTNAYMIFEADYTQDCAYCWHITDSQRCLDSDYLERCQDCYDCVSCVDCHRCQHLQNCSGCLDSIFLKNCVDCRDCFGCINLKNKQFYFRNQPCSEAEYRQKLAALHLDSAQNVATLKSELEDWFETFPHPHCNGFNAYQSTGDYLYNTDNCLDCYFVVDSKRARFVSESRNVEHTYDMDNFGSRNGVKDCYEVHEIGGAVERVYFSEQVWHRCQDIFYSKCCIDDCAHLFGCSGLREKQYCIFNKAYTVKEYEVLRDRIIAHMQETGEWGEYFPAHTSPFGYNETVAQEYYPLLRSEAENKGFNWFAGTQEETYQGPTELAPDSIRDADLTICDKILDCASTGTNYRILQSEYNFYKKHNLPIPNLCPFERHRLRDDVRNRRRLYERHCDDCRTALQSTYGPERTEKVVCSECYRKVVV